MIFDVHMHLPFQDIFPDAFLDGLVLEAGIKNPTQQKLMKKMARAYLKDENGDKLVAEMDEAGIDKSVLLIADFGIALGEPALTLAEMYAHHEKVLNRHPDRFVLFGGVDPARGQQGIDLFEKYVSRGVFKGLKLYPPCGFEMDDTRLYPLFEVCSEHGLPVLSHTGPSLGSLRTERRFPEAIRKVSGDFKKVNFILGHGGAVEWQQNMQLAKEIPNIYYEISTFQAVEPNQDALKTQLRQMIEETPDKLMFGTDWPMFLMGSSLKQIVSLLFDMGFKNDTLFEQFYYKNISKLLQ